MKSEKAIANRAAVRAARTESKVARAEAKLAKAEAKVETRKAKLITAKKIHEAAVAEARQLGVYFDTASAT